ncbi:MAG: hypothetical protein VW551_00325 [Euryarchaeota archaeon]|jgi:hypothetical protein
MDKNFILVAQNTKFDDYVKQACVCAMSIHATNKDASIAIITDDEVPTQYKHLFDHIIPIPWGDLAEKYEWKIHNRWKIYFVSPYESAVVLDTDMLVLDDLSTYFSIFENYDIWLTSNVLDYRGNRVSNDYYRKRFTKYNLPNTYFGLHYFKKSDFALEFYKWLDIITNNWKEFYKFGSSTLIQKNASMDVTSAMVVSMLGCESKVTNSQLDAPTFVHMKPNIQSWHGVTEKWQNKIGSYLTDELELYVGNFKQSGIFHYTEKDFLTDDIVNAYNNIMDIKHVEI